MWAVIKETPDIISVLCHKILLFEHQRKTVRWLTVFRDYGVISYGSGLRKDVVNQCLEFARPAGMKHKGACLPIFSEVLVTLALRDTVVERHAAGVVVTSPTIPVALVRACDQHSYRSFRRLPCSSIARLQRHFRRPTRESGHVT